MTGPTRDPIPSTKEYRDLQDMLGGERIIDHINSDGNCLFRSISKELLGHEKFHHVLRRITIQFMKVNLEQFKEYHDSMEAHLQKMVNLGVWGTSAEIYAIATLLQVDIFVFSKHPRDTQYRWVCYHPQPVSRFNFQEPKVVEQLARHPKPPSTYHIEIVHSFENHFDRVCPRNLLLTSMETAPLLNCSPGSKDPILIDT